MSSSKGLKADPAYDGQATEAGSPASGAAPAKGAPQLGRKALTLGEVTGEVVKDVELGGMEITADTKSSFRVFRYGTKTDMVMVAISAILNFGSGMLMPIFLSLFGDMMDSIGGAGGGKSTTWYVSAQLICGAISFVLCFAGSTLMEIAAERQMKTLQQSFLKTIMSQEMGWFDLFDAGKLSSILQQNVVTIREGIGMKLAQTFMFAGMFLGGYGVGFWKDWKLTLVVSATLPLIAAGSFAMFSAVGRADERSRAAYSKAGSVVEESLVTIRSVMAYGLESRQMRLFNDALAESYAQGVKSATSVGAGLALMLGTIFLSYALGFWYGGKLVADSLAKYGYEACFMGTENCYTGGRVLAVFFCVLVGAFSLGQAGPNISSLGKSGAAMNAIKNITSRKSLIDPYDEAGLRVGTGELKGEIEFKNVSFTYPSRPDKQIYNDLCFSIPAGKSVALVGGSGCGKSTAIQLLERFYDVAAGHVLVDGKDVRDYNLRSLRRQIALVSQEPRLFASSVKENIRAGRLDATDSEVIAAAKQANAHDFIEKFPQKYDTFVGEGGSQLSGGQKQRIAIARAILRNPSILILDEATSALDNESEKIVQMTLDKLLETSKRTTCIIAHRLSSIRGADCIIVLDNSDGSGSKVAEKGTHDELMALNGLYAALVRAQSLTTPEGDDSDDEDGNGAKERAAMEIAEVLEDLPRKASSIIRLHSKFSKRLSKAVSKDGRNGSKDFSGTQRFNQLMNEAAEGDLVDPASPIGKAESKGKGKVKTKKEKKEKGPGGFRKVMANFRDYKLQVGIGLLGATMNGLVFPCFAIVLSMLIGAFYKEDPQEVRDDTRFWALIFLGFSAGVAIANLMQHASFAWAGQKIIQIIRSLTFEAIIHQDMAFFDDPQNSTGNLSEILSGDVVLLKGWAGDNLGIYLQNIAALTAALIISFTASAKLAGVALGGFLVMAPAAMLESQMTVQPSGSTENKKKSQKDVETTSFLLQEVIINIRTVGAYTLEESMANRYDVIVNRDFSVGQKKAYIKGMLWGFSQFLQFAVQALCLWYGGKLVAGGEITTTQMMRAIFSLIMAAMGVGQSFVFATDGIKARAASHKIYGIIERKPRVDARSTAGQSCKQIQDRIHFSKVNFSYPQRPELPIYRNIDFQIKKGEVVALVGPSGCGKSTAVQLLERFYTLEDPEDTADVTASREPGAGDLSAMSPMSPASPRAPGSLGSFDYGGGEGLVRRNRNSGKITIDGTDIAAMNVKSLRSNIGMVNQEPILSSGTIAYNLSLGRPEDQPVTRAEMEAVTKSANAYNFIMDFPDKFDTNVGKMGGQLSGGQKQRIAIARALVREPQILILDEATSALDAESEQIVQAALDKVISEKKRTTIVIAHRLSTVKRSDKIVVLLNKGKGSAVAEVGTHEELLAKPDGIYARLCKIAENK